MKHAITLLVVGCAVSALNSASAAQGDTAQMVFRGCPPGWSASVSTPKDFSCRPPVPPKGFKCPEGSELRVSSCSISCVTRAK